MIWQHLALDHESMLQQVCNEARRAQGIPASRCILKGRSVRGTDLLLNATGRTTADKWSTPYPRSSSSDTGAAAGVGATAGALAEQSGRPFLY